MKLLVTGARGFIGSAFIRKWLQTKDSPIKEIVAFARNTNDWARIRLELDYPVMQAISEGKIKIVYGDLNDDISGLCEGLDAVVHFAARTFVDHSIRDPEPFVRSNVIGTMRLLEDARRHKVKAFIHVSTDEVYGQILTGAYSEDAPLNPRNPYAASKAGADALTQSYAHTFGMWTAVTRTENNYGPYQHPQKAIPLFTTKALADQNIPVYGDGKHVRQWLHVDDHVDGLMMLLEKSSTLPSGEVWHIAGSQELNNTQLAECICDTLGKPRDLITFIDDMNIRPGHDRRYALDCAKMRSHGWAPKIELQEGLRRTINWYAGNRQWK